MKHSEPPALAENPWTLIIKLVYFFVCWVLPHIQTYFSQQCLDFAHKGGALVASSPPCCTKNKIKTCINISLWQTMLAHQCTKHSQNYSPLQHIYVLEDKTTKCLLKVYWAWIMMDSGGAVFIYPTTDGQVKLPEVPKSLTQLWIQKSVQ